MDYGIIMGRFQPFHMHHLRYALAAKKRCKHLIVGITNPETFFVNENKNDLNRSLEHNNPLTYFERMIIARESLIKSGIKIDEFTIVPFPINRPEYISQYTPDESRYFLTIYDSWGEEKRKILESLSLNVIVLWRKSINEKGITASEIRENMYLNKNWEKYLVTSAAELIKSMKLDVKIKNAILRNKLESI